MFNTIVIFQLQCRECIALKASGQQLSEEKHRDSTVSDNDQIFSFLPHLIPHPQSIGYIDSNDNKSLKIINYSTHAILQLEA